MMCPGRFPSPSPSREKSLLPNPEDSPDVEFLYTRAKCRVPSSDFTASASSRKRPYFADTQSEPLISKACRTSPTPRYSHSTTPTHGRGQRRVSDSAYSPPRYSSKAAVQRANRQTTQRRVASAQLMSTSTQSPPRPTPVAPIQLSVSQSSHLIDVRLREMLRSPLPKLDIPTLLGPPTTGTLYALIDKLGHRRGIKIGWTNRADYEKRIEEHRTACGIVPHVIHVSHDVMCSYRAEQLVHLELMDRRLTWSCMGHKSRATTHEEWFDISQVEAKEIVQKWARFMNEQRPYDWRRQLSPFWGYLLRTRRLVMDDRFGHDERREQWKKMLPAPTRREHICFIIDVFRRIGCATRDVVWRNWPYCVAYFWQMLTLVYSFVTLLVCRNVFASSAFALVSVCAYLSIWSKLPLKRVRSKGS